MDRIPKVPKQQRVLFRVWTDRSLGEILGGAARVADEYSQTVDGFSVSQRITRTGYDVGAGFEWMFVQNWSLFAEYDYAGFGTAHMNNFVNPTDIKQNVSVILAGFNYRFTPRY
jgi:outer membrane immunogenic protein